jgi:hypothetical protein
LWGAARRGIPNASGGTGHERGSSIRDVLAALGALLVLFCTAQLFNPYLLRVEDKEWLDRLAAIRQSEKP